MYLIEKLLENRVGKILSNVPGANPYKLLGIPNIIEIFVIDRHRYRFKKLLLTDFLIADVHHQLSYGLLIKLLMALFFC